MGWTKPRQRAICHQAPNPLPVKNNNSCHCSYPFELSYFTLLQRLPCKNKSQVLYYSCWLVSKRAEARHHALHCNLSLQLPPYIDDYALLAVTTQHGTHPSSPANEDLALARSMMWLSPGDVRLCAVYTHRAKPQLSPGHRRTPGSRTH